MGAKGRSEPLAGLRSYLAQTAERSQQQHVSHLAAIELKCSCRNFESDR